MTTKTFRLRLQDLDRLLNRVLKQTIHLSSSGSNVTCPCKQSEVRDRKTIVLRSYTSKDNNVTIKIPRC